jgi:uncharacterized membrane protein
MFQLPKKKSLDLILLIAIAIAILIRIINLGSREFWYDEVLSLLLSSGQKGLYKSPEDVPVALSQYLPILNLPVERGLGDFFNTLEKLIKGLVKEPHPPLFFLGQHLWLRLFGNSEAAMRSLGVLYGVGAIASAYGVGRFFLGQRGGLLFAALLGLNPFYLFHTLNVRMYGSLVFWTVLSTWALLELSRIAENKSRSRWLWTVVLVVAVTGGLMTFYYFAFFLVAMAGVVLLLDRRQWLYYGLCFITSILLTLPWLWWGTRQQLRNADLERFNAPDNIIDTAIAHSENFLQPLGTHLILGDWVSILPPLTVTIAGIIALGTIVACSISLWQNYQRRILSIALLLGIAPLLLMLANDIRTGKFTIGFGFGRSVIFILPGCLLLITVWIERAAGKWRQLATIALLIFYLGIGSADFTLRSRWMFHEIADIIEQKPNASTLIVMNSPAWGHVLRLVYYMPPASPVMLLAQQSPQLLPALEKTLARNSDRYQRILWLDSARPVWGKPSTEVQRKQVQQIINKQYRVKKTQQLLGTWELDNFYLSLYERDANL